jgi:hypothetical protein
MIKVIFSESYYVCGDGCCTDTGFGFKILENDNILIETHLYEYYNEKDAKKKLFKFLKNHLNKTDITENVDYEIEYKENDHNCFVEN